MSLLANEILHELYGSEPYRTRVIQSLVSTLVFKVLRAADAVIKDPYGHHLDEDMERRSLIAEFFRSDMPYGRDKKDLAELLHLSERQLSRFLEEEYGKSFGEMVMQCRMEHAAWLLQTTDTAIHEIAEELGYQSPSAFYKAFRTWYGIPPVQYRKQQK